MLTDQQKQFYADNGYVLVPGLFTPEEAALYRKEAHDLAQRLSAVREINATWGSADSVAKGKATQLLHCHDVQFQSAAFTRMLVNEKFTEAAADIIGPNVQLHHTKMFIKPPEKGSPFPMHQAVLPAREPLHDRGHHPLRRCTDRAGLRPGRPRLA